MELCVINYFCVIILFLNKSLLHHEHHKLHVAKVIHLLLEICDALFRHKVICRSYFGVNIVARRDDPLEYLIANWV